MVQRFFYAFQKHTPLLVVTGQRITESNNKHAVNNFPAKYSYG